MKKIKLGNNPKTFTKDVLIVLLDGDTAPLKITFKYRTRSEFAALVDEGIDKAMASVEASKEYEVADAATPARTTFVERYAAVDKERVEHVLKIAEGWDLDDAFTEANLLQFEDENPGALHAISIAYAQAVAEARAKN
jgi:hypothetical protein